MSKIMLVALFATITSFFVPSAILLSKADAKALYVSTNGDDSISYEENDISHPWRTPIKAWYNAHPGDIVYFRGGTYAITSQIITKFNGYDGTAQSPITFRNYGSEEVIFQSNLSTVFSIQKKYNHVRGIHFVGASTWFFLGEDISADGFEISDCIAEMGAGGDNVGFVVVYAGTQDVIVRNCKVQGAGLGSEGVHLNTACIVLLRAEHVRVLNCELYNAPIGIYFKHANPQRDTGNEIAYNYIHDTDRYSIELNSNYTYIHDNLFGPNNATFRINEANGVPGGDHNIIDHNTFYNCAVWLSDDTQSGDLYPGANDNTFTNNIFTSVSTCCNNNIFDYNLFANGHTLGTHAVSGTPIFSGGSDPPVNISDFSLASGSPGKNAGSDGKDLGADISLVGVRGADGQGGSPPSAPSGLHKIQ